MARLRVVYIGAAEMRRLFNAGSYVERAQSGEIRYELTRDGHPSPKRSGQPFCTRSQIVTYWDRYGQRIAVVHQYRLRDGRLGGSGKPDPKLLVVDDVIYRLDYES